MLGVYCYSVMTIVIEIKQIRLESTNTRYPAQNSEQYHNTSVEESTNGVTTHTVTRTEQSPCGLLCLKNDWTLISTLYPCSTVMGCVSKSRL